MEETKLLVISNRSCHTECANQDVFGSGFNQAGPCELRVAEASFDEQSKQWHLSLMPEDRSQPEHVCQASNDQFKRIVQNLTSGDRDAEKWVLFVPGYCSPCLEGLEKSRQLQKAHGVNVILFSWPSDPREAVINPVESYRRTQEAAAISSVALDRVLSSLQRVFVEPARRASLAGRFKFSLMAHSLGNYVIQKLVQAKPIHQASSFTFDNVILHQPDVDFVGCQAWIKALQVEGSRYVTTNQYDDVLRLTSDLVNPVRLGQITHHVAAGEDILHVDFTGARHVESQHWFFGNTIENQIIQMFCTRALHGDPAEVGLFADAAEPGRYQAFPFDPFAQDQGR